MSDETDDPIQVHATPLPDQLWAAVRQIAPAAMAFAIGKGWLDTDLSVLLGIAGGVLWPIIAGQLKTRERAQQLTKITLRTDDSVAVLK